MNFEELKDAAVRLIENFGDGAGFITLGNMLGSLDQWRNSQSFYINFVQERM